MQLGKGLHERFCNSDKLPIPLHKRLPGYPIPNGCFDASSLLLPVSLTLALLLLLLVVITFADKCLDLSHLSRGMNLLCLTWSLCKSVSNTGAELTPPQALCNKLGSPQCTGEISSSAPHPAGAASHPDQQGQCGVTL